MLSFEPINENLLVLYAGEDRIQMYLELVKLGTFRQFIWIFDVIN